MRLDLVAALAQTIWRAELIVAQQRIFWREVFSGKSSLGKFRVARLVREAAFSQFTRLRLFRSVVRHVHSSFVRPAQRYSGRIPPAVAVLLEAGLSRWRVLNDEAIMKNGIGGAAAVYEVVYCRVRAFSTALFAVSA